MNKLKLIILLCFVIIKADEITSSCKDYKHEECLSNHWKFEDSDQEEALKYYEKAKIYINENKLRQAYASIVKAREIIQEDQTLNSKMKKNIYSGSSLRPRLKIYKTKIKNIYNIESLELDASSKNTALPLLIVECGKKQQTIHLYNINKSIKDNKKINNMHLEDIKVSINGQNYEMSEIESGNKGQTQAKINKCDKLSTSFEARNSLSREKSIYKIRLFKKDM